jgi:hypothetical protein
VLAASDEDFYCRVVRGSRVQHLVERLDPCYCDIMVGQHCCDTCVMETG